MKKTFTINLGGIVFHIDEDAYELLDKYFVNRFFQRVVWFNFLKSLYSVL